tara:strand:+ start:148 stop:591 length:444 start_codon:yes stop_codon:yes gene_type:complete
MVRVMSFFLGFITACLPPVVEHTFMVDSAIEWVADAEDNICGLSDLRMVRQPGVVDWTALMGATSEMKKIKKEGIKKDSPEGVLLITKAESKCRTACVKQMRKTKVDSMWKRITHKTKLPWEQTDAVIDIIKNEQKKAVLFKWRETE